MANVVKAYGLKALYNLGGGIIPTRMCVVLSAGAAVGVGDPVIYGGDGNIAGLASVVIANAANVGVVGVIQGILSRGPDSLVTHGGITLTERKVVVALSYPTVVFQVNASDTTGLNSADIGSNFDLVVTSTVDTLTGRSGWEIDDNTTGTGTDIQVRLIGFANRPDNEQAVTGTDTKNIACLVTFLESGVVALPSVGV